MEPVKDTVKVEKLFASGHVSLVDPDTKYRYTMMAYCPRDNGRAYISRFERWGSRLSRVVFSCSDCLNTFEAEPQDIWIV
ncbi:hypothetical protein [Dehalogenimonas alkenigignens]|uniref:Uncharacterized protein n=1 Tax=Dehalogenimonas alkenigignens TaxID=1217799 RepID=A0A0W0GJQ5_9CHLR|nr:hypothetical protein [Dehalogenimonas alkenigignens]KTB48800.1 hypothetical protein DEALK_16470 [Dehalogenimonas alkenigignens]PVV84790.1 hypothetical protein DD509_00300 [Dehalogenimonas alkenigignens]